MLLASAWCYIKGNTFGQALQIADQLISSCPNSLLVPEAFLVKGYCYTMQREYSSAKDMFQKCIDLCKKPVMSKEEFVQKTSEIEGTIKQFSQNEREILANSLQRPNEKVIGARPMMREQFTQFESEQKSLLKIRSEGEQIRLFSRSKDKIQKDAEYALATAMHLEQSKQKETIIKKQQENEQEIENSIEKLRKEMEDLDKQKKK